MEFRTLFRAYVEAESRKSDCARARGGGQRGIAVHADNLAVEWQRYDRLARRIVARVEGYRVCPLCAATHHYPNCPRRSK